MPDIQARPDQRPPGTLSPGVICDMMLRLDPSEPLHLMCL